MGLIAAGGFAQGYCAAIDHGAIARQGAGRAIVGDKQLPLALTPNIAVVVALRVRLSLGCRIEKGSAICAGINPNIEGAVGAFWVSCAVNIGGIGGPIAVGDGEVGPSWVRYSGQSRQSCGH